VGYKKNTINKIVRFIKITSNFFVFFKLKKNPNIKNIAKKLLKKYIVKLPLKDGMKPNK